jgi:lipopolysaccharide biosynthesis glycosyltransferase
MELNFVYCFDDNFNLQALTSIKSLLNKITKKANIFIIHKNIESFKKMSSFISEHEKLSSLHIYQFDSTKVNLPPIKSHVSEATYYRLFISQYLPKNIEFLVYLDADIVSVNDPTSKLLETFSEIKSDGNVIAAKIETTREQEKMFFNTLDLKSDVKFNAGVLVIDFNAWIKEEVESDLLKILNLRHNEIFDYDQEVLNIYFDGQFTKLDENLNYQAIGGQDENLYSFIEKNVNFLHYLGKGKPWNVDNYLFSTSKFYQKEFNKLGFDKPHLVFPKNISMLKKFLKLVFSSDFKNYESRFKFLKYSFISFFKK